MTRQLLIQKTLENLSKLPEQKLKEVSDFTEFLLSKVEDSMLTEGIQHLASESQVFNFLEEDEDLYSEDDLKEKYQ
ncbi:hypothetical protein MKJ04_08020 [Pontibacter sp. E15-1]|uniref:hypothetical protein n=1 Tax=Pontibacter sp. E15-1 TaxID=2919918 RepID=UPI001F4F573B|nr:hypothetical protein [Pontibacter sp. E15-1]MCJ8164787.1 hypothetical protein [Pontibacter sp. E15-1]